MIYLQIRALRTSSRDRACPRALSLVYPPRTRVPLSLHKQATLRAFGVSRARSGSGALSSRHGEAVQAGTVAVVVLGRCEGGERCPARLVLPRPSRKGRFDVRVMARGCALVRTTFACRGTAACCPSGRLGRGAGARAGVDARHMGQAGSRPSVENSLCAFSSVMQRPVSRLAATESGTRRAVAETSFSSEPRRHISVRARFDYRTQSWSRSAPHCGLYW
jgi:hypothetical protein